MRSWPFLLAVVACAPEGRGLDGDPRCVSICEIDEPPLEGAFAICSQASARQCMSECETRIANVSDTCATCLLSGAFFGTGPIEADADCDASGTCTIEGPGGSCTYVATDDEDRDRCTRIAYPREEVTCSPSFTDARNCATNCS